MSNDSGDSNYKPALWEKITVVTVAVGIVVLAGFVVVRNQKFPDPNLVVILRIILSLAVAVLGATIPGFLQVNWENRGLAIRAGGALALFIVTYLLSPKVVKETPPNGEGTGKMDSKVELVEATFPLPDRKAELGQATLDVKVRNVGGKAAFLKRADFSIRKKWVLKPVTLRWKPIPPSAEYQVVLPEEKDPPYLVSKPFSQEIVAGRVDRFLITFHCKDEVNATIYLMDVDLIYDEDDKSLKKSNFIFVIPGANYYTGLPDKGSVQSHEAVKHNKQVVAEVSAAGGEMSPHLNKLLDAIKANKD
jgi:hypothetical protein